MTDRPLRGEPAPRAVRRPRAPALAAALALALLAFAPGAAPAQSLDMIAGSEQPIEVFADNGIEWHQNGKVFVASGNARAIRGDVVLYADVLRAYYRPGDDGETRIWRLDAEGNVKIASPGETAFGDKAVYDLDNAVFVLTGRNLKLTTQQGEITARDSLEYWTAKAMTVARGDAVAVQQGKRLTAQVLTAHMVQGKGGGATRIERVNAFGDVLVTTAQEVVTAEKGVYHVDSGMVTLSGSVKMTRDDNQLNGCRAEVNLNSGVSRLFSCGNGEGGRIRGLLVPKKDGK